MFDPWLLNPQLTALTITRPHVIGAAYDALQHCYNLTYLVGCCNEFALGGMLACAHLITPCVASTERGFSGFSRSFHPSFCGSSHCQ
jgi:hypothetical protein